MPRRESVSGDDDKKEKDAKHSSVDAVLGKKYTIERKVSFPVTSDVLRKKRVKCKKKLFCDPK